MKILIMYLGLFATAIAYSKDFTSQKYKTEVLELYSSEGCSSCPPAEKQLSMLKNHKDLWIKFIPINFHVDYWNKLGWHDVYSKNIFTERQHQYARLWNVKTVYTPAFVMGSRDLGPILNFKLLDDLLPNISDVIIKVLTQENKDNFKFIVNTENLNLKKKYEIFISIMGHNRATNVTSGENKGRTLVQNFVALSSEKESLKHGKHEFIIAKTKTINSNKLSFVVWITESNSFNIVQSVGGYLN